MDSYTDLLHQLMSQIVTSKASLAGHSTCLFAGIITLYMQPYHVRLRSQPACTVLMVPICECECDRLDTDISSKRHQCKSQHDVGGRASLHAAAKPTDVCPYAQWTAGKVTAGLPGT
jgi:hypothetical protein